MQKGEVELVMLAGGVEILARVSKEKFKVIPEIE